MRMIAILSFFRFRAGENKKRLTSGRIAFWKTETSNPVVNRLLKITQTIHRESKKLEVFSLQTILHRKNMERVTKMWFLGRNLISKKGVKRY